MFLPTQRFPFSVHAVSMQIYKGMLSVQRTLLCRLMVYSRVTTSAMAERVFLPVVLTLLDISANG